MISSVSLVKLKNIKSNGLLCFLIPFYNYISICLFHSIFPCVIQLIDCILFLAILALFLLRLTLVLYSFVSKLIPCVFYLIGFVGFLASSNYFLPKKVTITSGSISINPFYVIEYSIAHA